MPETKQLLSINQAAAILSCSPKTVRRRISAGDLTGYRVGPRLVRIDAVELETLLRPIPNARTRAA